MEMIYTSDGNIPTRRVLRLFHRKEGERWQEMVEYDAGDHIKTARAYCDKEDFDGVFVPATHGYFLLDIDHETRLVSRIPVVAWHVSGRSAAPVTLYADSRDCGGEYVQNPDGTIATPSAEYADLDDLLRSLCTDHSDDAPSPRPSAPDAPQDLPADQPGLGSS
jgi:hypothetical protein